MLTAHANTPIDEFIAQLRTYVIAMNLSTQVVDCVDRLAGVDEIEGRHDLELQEAEEQSEKRGRESMKDEITDLVSQALADNPSLSGADVVMLLEKVEV